MEESLLGIGAFCLIALILLMSGWRKAGRLMLLAWNLLLSGLLLRVLVLPSHRFDGWEHFQQAAAVFLVSIAALAGSWSGMRMSRRRRT